MRIFIVTWTILISFGQYGTFEKSFEKKFCCRNDASKFVVKYPHVDNKEIKFIFNKIDSIFVDTSTVFKDPNKGFDFEEMVK